AGEPSRMRASALDMPSFSCSACFSTCSKKYFWLPRGIVSPVWGSVLTHAEASRAARKIAGRRQGVVRMRRFKRDGGPRSRRRMATRPRFAPFIRLRCPGRHASLTAPHRGGVHVQLGHPRFVDRSRAALLLARDAVSRAAGADGGPVRLARQGAGG